MTPVTIRGRQEIQRSNRACALVRKLVAARWFDVPSLAAALDVDQRTLGLYIAGGAPMPEERQALLARLLVSEVPSLRGTGRNMLRQSEDPAVVIALAASAEDPEGSR